MHQIKAIFLDLDGTLVNGKRHQRHYISPENLAACKAAQEQGIYVIVNSGRGTNSCRKIQEKIRVNNFGNYFVSFNGAHIEDISKKKSLYNKKIDKKDVNEIIKYAVNHNFSIKVDEPFEFYGTNLLTKLYVKWSKMDAILHKEYFLDKIKDQSYFKIMFTGRKRKIVKLLKKELDAKFPHLEIATSGNGWVIEITGKKTSKGNGVKFLCDKLNIKLDQTAAIGDSMNDESMFNVVGVSVSMKNASETLKVIASESTLGHKDNGVASWINENLLKEDDN